ncbi:hypothetical protein [Longimycelium tulufanense]|uniref:hypothetical protein n=1 Tax=Longimycelium tulufanense TaxID=907463 RepID=UPI00166875D7|nr:hypothetical protein [Longimycelium tulufanense]
MTLSAAGLGLTFAQGAHAAALPHATPAAEASYLTNVVHAPKNPFENLKLDGLTAKYHFMCPAGHCVDYWSLVLTDDLAAKPYQGGEFFLYAPDSGEFGWFLVTDIVQRTVSGPYQVQIIDTEFLRSHPRVEVRYGNPDRPEQARVIASASQAK